MILSPAFASLAIALLARHATAVDQVRDPSLDSNLAMAATQLDRLALLSSDDDWLFDFTAQQPYYNFAPGGVTNMNAATFPAAKGNGMTSTTVPESNSVDTSLTGSQWRCSTSALAPCCPLTTTLEQRTTSLQSKATRQPTW